MSLALRLKRKIHGKQHLSQLFNPNPSLSGVVAEALEFCARYEGLKVDEEMIEEARRDSMRYPYLTVDEFVKGKINEKLR